MDWAHPARRGTAPARPHFNVVNDGVHAPNPLDFQEFMIAPPRARSLPAAVQAGAEVYSALRNLLPRTGTRPDWVTRVAPPRSWLPQTTGSAASSRSLPVLA
ncbi:MAG TPA: hypothetical protein VF933_30040 [Streptosporangiaceae bacterium]